MVTAIEFDGTLVIGGGQLCSFIEIVAQVLLNRTGRGSVIRAHFADGGLIDVDLNG